jgi:hypothetical protein
MGERGVEPLRLAALVPKTSVSAISPLARITIPLDIGDVIMRH